MKAEITKRLLGCKRRVYHLLSYGRVERIVCCFAFVIMLFTVTGCSVNIGGRERPLLRHGRIEGD
ncbi:hypothetical protein LCGC14_2713050, partial [marine sediment metagenome]